MRFLFFLTTLIFPFIATAQKKTDWEEMNLKGKVTRIVEHEYQMNNANDDGEDQARRCVYEFNNNGNKIKETLYDGNDIDYCNTWKYDKTRLVEESSEAAKITNKRVYQYNNKQQPVLIKINRIVQVIGYKNKPVAVVNQKFNNKGLLTEKAIENLDIKTKEFWRYFYNEQGYIKEIQQGKSADSCKTYQTFTYDDKGRKLTQTEHFWKDGSLMYTMYYEYDDKDNVTKEETKYVIDKQLLQTYIYTYDSKGNWITRRELANGSTYALTMREITY